MVLRSLNTFLHLGVMALLLLASSYSGSELSLIAGCMLACWAVTHLALSPKIRDSAPQKTGLVIAFTVLYWIGYLTKFGLALFIANEFWVVPMLIRSTELLANLPQAYLIATIGYISLWAGIFVVPSHRILNFELREFRASFWLVTTSLLLALLIKIYLKVTYHLAIPSVTPDEMGIPYLTGIMSLVIDTGMIFPATIPFIIGLTRGQQMWAAIGFGVAVFNAGIDLTFGAKDTMIYQIIIFGLLLFMFRRSSDRLSPQAHRLFRKSALLVGVAGLLALLIYPLVNQYRFARLAGNDIAASIQIAGINGPFESINPVMAIYNRLTGIEVLTALLGLPIHFSSSTVLQGLFSTDLVSTFTYMILGVEQDATRFSITQIGYFYVVGGFPVLIIGCLSVGIFFSFIQELILRFKFDEVLKLTFLTVLWILSAKLMLGGGNLFLVFKELGIVVGTFVVWGWLANGGSFRSRQSRMTGRPSSKTLAVQ